MNERDAPSLSTCTWHDVAVSFSHLADQSATFIRFRRVLPCQEGYTCMYLSTYLALHRWRKAPTKKGGATQRDGRFQLAHLHRIFYPPTPRNPLSNAGSAEPAHIPPHLHQRLGCCSSCSRTFVCGQYARVRMFQLTRTPSMVRMGSPVFDCKIRIV